MTKYIAKLDGVIVGKRTTQNRTYTHAIVVQACEAWARDYAYNRSAAEIAQDRKNFAWHASKLSKRVVDKIDYLGDFRNQITHQELAEAKAIVDAGVDAYIAARRNEAIASFEQRLADGGFKPHVAAWAGRLDLAQKAAPQHADGVQRKLVAIVPAEIAPSNARTAKALED